jgi:threonine dehydratase
MLDSTAQQYLRRILNARVYDVAVETPLALAGRLSARIGNRLLLKREDLQPVFSFKLRGAYNKMVNLPPRKLQRGVVAASAGNHAQGVALSAQKLGCRAVIVMPVTTPLVKLEAVRALGAEVVLHGDSFFEAHAHARGLQRAQQLTFVHPFDDPDVIAGQGTVGMELLRQYERQECGPLSAVFVAIGGGGLIAGVAAYIKALRPSIKVIGVQTDDSDAMARSLRAGRRITLPRVGLFSDGTAVRRVGKETFRLCQSYVDDIILVDSDAICAAIKDVFEDTRCILEPAGALAVAGAKAFAQRESLSQKTLAAITCGANVNFERLRFVAERAEVGEKQEAIFGITLPEVRGSFRNLCALVKDRNVTEINYRMSDRLRARLLLGVELSRGEEPERLRAAFEAGGFPALDLTDNELAKLHMRHMAGGATTLEGDEHLYRFAFPERPGALGRFLAALPAPWNVSLFHYRNEGSSEGRVLVGLQVPPEDRRGLGRLLRSLGLPYSDESRNPAYRFFLR